MEEKYGETYHCPHTAIHSRSETANHFDESSRHIRQLGRITVKTEPHANQKEVSKEELQEVRTAHECAKARIFLYQFCIFSPLTRANYRSCISVIFAYQVENPIDALLVIFIFKVNIYGYLSRYFLEKLFKSREFVVITLSYFIKLIIFAFFVGLCEVHRNLFLKLGHLFPFQLLYTLLNATKALQIVIMSTQNDSIFRYTHVCFQHLTTILHAILKGLHCVFGGFHRTAPMTDQIVRSCTIVRLWKQF